MSESYSSMHSAASAATAGIQSPLPLPSLPIDDEEGLTSYTRLTLRVVAPVRLGEQVYVLGDGPLGR